MASLIRFRTQELLMSLLVLLFFGLLAKYNFDLSAARARDWERKEQVKSLYNTLEQGYLVDNVAFPPSTHNYEMTGCNDLKCPTEDGTGNTCTWGINNASMLFQCGEYLYRTIPSMPDNHNTPFKDTMRYKRLKQDTAVLEICLEYAKDPEQSPASMSKIGWSKQDCPSQTIFMLPETLRTSTE